MGKVFLNTPVPAPVCTRSSSRIYTAARAALELDQYFTWASCRGATGPRAYKQRGRVVSEVFFSSCPPVADCDVTGEKVTVLCLARLYKSPLRVYSSVYYCQCLYCTGLGQEDTISTVHAGRSGFVQQLEISIRCRSVHGRVSTQTYKFLGAKFRWSLHQQWQRILSKK